VDGGGDGWRNGHNTMWEHNATNRVGLFGTSWSGQCNGFDKKDGYETRGQPDEESERERRGLRQR